MAKSARARREELRGDLLSQGLAMARVAEEFGRRFAVRPRVAWRYAMGWPQWKLVQEFRTTNPELPIAESRVSEWEAWPFGGTKPSLEVLGALALTFGHGCTLQGLVDDADRARMSPGQILALGPAEVVAVDHRHADVAARSQTAGDARRMKPEMVRGRPELDHARAFATVGSMAPRLVMPAPGADGRGRLEAPAGRYFTGTTLPAQPVRAIDDGRIVATLPKPKQGRDPLGGIGRALVLAAVESPDGAPPALYGMDARRARRWVTDPAGENRLPFPRAYELDDLTLGVLWAVANFDASLLDDDAALERTVRTLHVYEELPSSTVTGASVDDLSPASQMWLGSQFCADHIQRHSPRLTQQPDFWTREQRGEEASAWLLFEHKLNYLRVYAGDHSVSPERTFCIPPAVVSTSPRPERILLLLAAALMESFTITVNIVTEPEYAALPGFVTDAGQRAIVATWVGTESLWHVDIPDQRLQLREFSDALAFARDHSVSAGATSSERLQALARYLDLDWSWLVARCAQLGDYGTAGLISPRSRLLSTDGIDRACRFIGAITPADR